MGNQSSLQQADSLFEQGKYTESFEIYHGILSQTNEATPQMLMKMAFIKEGLGNYSQALLYLNKYYLLTYDENARSKMDDIATENNLSGYDMTDYGFIKGVINEYYLQSNVLVVAIALLLLSVVVYRKIKLHVNAYPYVVILCLLLGAFFYVSNYHLTIDQVIVSDDHVYLMQGPSSGSGLVDVIKKGHRLTVLGEDEAWVKVQWNNAVVYVKQSKVERVI
ncbi:SH3 domain-containing protein [Reichenbachiella sp. 5M10]|uniref:SH3 domain-containing protein n=1 Tax=Reichenbachiella sp. 5M10 TaxID=1889772 RepID=UPI0013044392|nr:SH3 domain-containing protein [Reichenbachiella sp. 5M10]